MARMTYQQIDDLLLSLDDNTLDKLISCANAESRKRFDRRCARVGKSLVTVCRPENREGGER